MKREKREYTETVSSVVKIIIAFLVMILFLAIGYERGKNSKEKPPAPVILPIPTVAINLCSPPFNAIPNDSLSDIEAFRLASEVIGNIRAECGETPMNITLNIPAGYYILDDSIDFKDAKVRIKTPPIIGLYGKDITLSGNSFMMLGDN